MNFKQGEKIICVRPGSAELGLEKDRVYTCLNSFVSVMGENVVEILEAMPPNFYCGYQASRFKRVKPDDLIKVKQEKTIEI